MKAVRNRGLGNSKKNYEQWVLRNTRHRGTVGAEQMNCTQRGHRETVGTKEQ